jgi:hypothetical protein
MSGLVTMTPSSVDAAGGTATINANGGVDFQNVVSVSLNGVFTSGDDGFDNYLIVMNFDASAAQFSRINLRSSKTDNQAANYTTQRLRADGGSPNGSRATNLTYWDVSYAGTNLNGNTIHMYGPSLGQHTAARTVTVASASGAYLADYSMTHSSSAAFDGFTYSRVVGNMTGNIIVMGYAE